ncbi:hypothetical protein HUG17_8078 [Dermatophagoides farinae]|uniref:Uncharacterized protein n=1 Tax=Dermatophagoides farinae TaxID=6954 RepID=A0A9D4NYK6_DERFA|nr:uncharacterized protein LOC124495356 isoform X2 [Dermatophagoides farinae]KAH7640609.1 hypothetical protein HUG17_8078 [Dermatophagoides farinae]
MDLIMSTDDSHLGGETILNDQTEQLFINSWLNQPQRKELLTSMQKHDPEFQQNHTSKEKKIEIIELGDDDDDELILLPSVNTISMIKSSFEEKGNDKRKLQCINERTKVESSIGSRFVESDKHAQFNYATVTENSSIKISDSSMVIQSRFNKQSGSKPRIPRTLPTKDGIIHFNHRFDDEQMDLIMSTDNSHLGGETILNDQTEQLFKNSWLNQPQRKELLTSMQKHDPEFQQNHTSKEKKIEIIELDDDDEQLNSLPSVSTISMMKSSFEEKGNDTRKLQCLNERAIVDSSIGSDDMVIQSRFNKQSGSKPRIPRTLPTKDGIIHFNHRFDDEQMDLIMSTDNSHLGGETILNDQTEHLFKNSWLNQPQQKEFSTSMEKHDPEFQQNHTSNEKKIEIIELDDDDDDELILLPSVNTISMMKSSSEEKGNDTRKPQCLNERTKVDSSIGSRFVESDEHFDNVNSVQNNYATVTENSSLKISDSSMVIQSRINKKTEPKPRITLPIEDGIIHFNHRFDDDKLPANFNFNFSSRKNKSKSNKDDYDLLDMSI